MAWGDRAIFWRVGVGFSLIRTSLERFRGECEKGCLRSGVNLRYNVERLMPVVAEARVRGQANGKRLKQNQHIGEAT